MLDKTETEMNSDLNKEELYRLKEDLFYTSLTSAKHQAGPHRDRPYHAPPGQSRTRSCCPTSRPEFSDLDKDTSIALEQREERNSPRRTGTPRCPRISTSSQLLRAYSLYERDVEYVVQEGKVMIVDENTGRVMPGRRWSDGLHQAVEAKENA